MKLGQLLPTEEPSETLGFPDGPVLGCGASIPEHTISSLSPHLTYTEQGFEGEGHGISSWKLQVCLWAELGGTGDRGCGF